MNNYEILYQSIISLIEYSKKRIEAIDKELLLFSSKARENRGEINKLSKEKNKKNNLYKALVCYDSVIKESKSKNFRTGAGIGIVFLIAITALKIVSNNLQDIPFVFKDFATIFALSTGLSLVIGAKIHYSETRDLRALYKEYGNQIYAFPSMISCIDKDLNLEYESKDYYEEKIRELETEKETLYSDIKKYEEAILFIEERVKEIVYPCRHDIETINEVFETDMEAQDAVKLAREKNTSKID